MSSTEITVVPKVPTIDQLRKDLEVSQTAYDRSKTYHNAVGIQKATQALDRRAEARRATFKLVQGSEGNHTFTDVEVCGHALREIMHSIKEMRTDADITGTLLHVYNVSKQALIATNRLEDNA